MVKPLSYKDIVVHLAGEVATLRKPAAIAPVSYPVSCLFRMGSDKHAP